MNYIFNYQDEQETPEKTLKSVVDGRSEARDNSGDESADEEDIKCYKMTFVVNTSLNMGVGKIAAQVRHFI